MSRKCCTTEQVKDRLPLEELIAKVIPLLCWKMLLAVHCSFMVGNWHDFLKMTNEKLSSQDEASCVAVFKLGTS